MLRMHVRIAPIRAFLQKTDMSSTYLIRPALADDAPRIAVLGAQVWIHTYATAAISEVIAQYVLASFTPERFRTLAQDPGAVMLVAEREGNLAGYIVVRFASQHADIQTEIETLYVQACFAGQGIGSGLLTRAKEIALTKTGSRSIWLMVNSQNESAIAFYRSLGMKQDGLTYFELGGVKHENKVMIAVD